MKGDTAFAPTFSGSVLGSPLYMEDGPAGKGAFFIATTLNDVYALDETTGAVVWKQSIGPAPLATGVACGNVAPVGIISTPVIDAASRTIFVAGGVGDAATIMHHEVHALSVDTGAERLGWPVDVSALTAPGPIAFNAPAQNQRSALSLVNGILYVPYGGHAGDCDQYRGWVVAIKIADPTQTAAWATGGMGEGIGQRAGWRPRATASWRSPATTWRAAPFTSTARRSSTSGAWRRSTARPASSSRAPGTTWTSRTRTSGRAAASSSSLPGATPSILMAAVSKNGLFFLLDPANLGGMDGYLAQLTVAHGPVKAAPVAYRTALGTYVLFSAVNAFPFCPSGTPDSSQHGLFGRGRHHAWLATDGEDRLVQRRQPPAVHRHDDGRHPRGDRVGQQRRRTYTASTATPGCIFVAVSDLICPGVRMASPIAVKGRLIQASANGRLCSYSLH